MGMRETDEGRKIAVVGGEGTCWARVCCFHISLSQDILFDVLSNSEIARGLMALCLKLFRTADNKSNYGIDTATLPTLA